MTVDAFIARMRTKQAALFESAVDVNRLGAPGAFNDSTASYAPPSTSLIYTGPALVRPVTETVVNAGGTSVEVTNYMVKLPVDTPVRVGDDITVTASTHDTALVGIGLRVIDVPKDEWQISRRVTCALQTDRPI